MSESKKRAVTIKSFIKGASSPRISAQAYLEAHEEFLSSGELAPLVTPIIAQVKERKVMPTPALVHIQQVAFDYMMESEKRKALEKLAATASGNKLDKHTAHRVRSTASQTSVVYDKNGNILTAIDERTGEEYDLIKDHDLFQNAQGWCHRRLDQCEPNAYAIITSNKVITSKGVMTTRIERGTAISALLKRKPGMGAQISKSAPKSTSRLGFGVKCNPSKATFSAG